MITENKISKKPCETDIRIASHNVLSDGTCDSRYDLIVESTSLLEADVVVFQEYTPNFYPALNPQLEKMGYTLVLPDDVYKLLSKDTHNTTPIFYRSERLELLDSGYKRYNTVPTTKEYSKSYTWALFKDKITGKQFVTTSTHMTSVPSAGGLSGDELRKLDAEELLAKLDEVREKYGKDIPTFLAGDFNSHPATDAFLLVAEKYINSRTCENIPERLNIDYGTFCGAVGVYPPKNNTGYVIDHIFMSSKNINPKQFQHIATELAIKSSDHLPIALDFDLK